MAEGKNYIIKHGLSGKIGDLIVFSQRDGKAYRSSSNRSIFQYDRNDPDALKTRTKRCVYNAYTDPIPIAYKNDMSK